MDIKISFMPEFPDQPKPATGSEAPIHKGAGFDSVLKDALAQSSTDTRPAPPAPVMVFTGPPEPADPVLTDYMGTKSLSGFCSRLAKNSQ